MLRRIKNRDRMRKKRHAKTINNLSPPPVSTPATSPIVPESQLSSAPSEFVYLPPSPTPLPPPPPTSLAPPNFTHLPLPPPPLPPLPPPPPLPPLPPPHTDKKTPSKKYNNQSHAARYLKQQTCIGTDIWLNANEIISKPKVPIKRKFTHCKRCELLQKKLEIICRKWPISKKLSLTRYSQSLLENDPQVPKKIIKKKVLPPSQPQTKTSTITPTNRLVQLHRARRQDAEKRRQSEETAKALEEFYSNTSLFAPPTREQSSNNNVVTILGEFKEANILNYGIGSNFPSSTPVQQIIKYK